MTGMWWREHIRGEGIVERLVSEYVELWVTEPNRRNPLVYVSLVCRGSVVETTAIGITKRAAERRAFLKAHKQARNVGYSPRTNSGRRTWWKGRELGWSTEAGNTTP